MRYRTGLLFLTLILSATILAASPLPVVSPTLAAAEVVGTGTPASCTRQALADALAGGGSITFNCGTAPHTILVAEAFDVTAPETVVDGGGLITLRGENSRIFNHRTFGLIGSSALTLKNLTITGGRASGGGAAASEANGGAIRSSFGAARPEFKPSLVIEQVSFRDNDTTLTGVPDGLGSGDFGGGAIFAQGGSVTIRRSTFVDNDANNGSGGAIHILQSALSIADSSFSANTALGAIPANSLGGAIYIDGLGSEQATFRVERSSFTNNRAYNTGGAIYLNLYENSSSAEIVDSSFEQNAVTGGTRAQGGAVGGGGTQLGNRPTTTGNPAITISGSLFSGNSVRRTIDDEQPTEDGSGGALAFPQRARLSISNSTFEGNRAFGTSVNANGGALYVVNNTDLFEVFGSTFANNYAGWVGGAISNSKLPGSQPGGRVRNTIFANNTADNGPNDWQIQQHCSSELMHDGLSLQYPPRLTGANFFNDVTCFAGKSAPNQATDQQFRDPRLAPLADNGGPTRTMAIGADSPAFNAVPTTGACPPVDQRGVARPQAGGCDLGAYELVASLNAVPALLKVGTEDRTITLTGFGFTNESVGQVGSVDRPTRLAGPGVLSVSLTASDVATTGTLRLSVRGPGSALGTVELRIVAQIVRVALPIVRR